MIYDDYVPDWLTLAVAAGTGSRAEATWGALRLTRRAGGVFSLRPLGVGEDAFRRGFLGGISHVDRSAMRSSAVTLLGPGAPPGPAVPPLWRYPAEALREALGTPRGSIAAPDLCRYEEGPVISAEPSPSEAIPYPETVDPVPLLLACAAAAAVTGGVEAGRRLQDAVLTALEDGARGYGAYVPGGGRMAMTPAEFYAFTAERLGRAPVRLPRAALPDCDLA